MSMPVINIPNLDRDIVFNNIIASIALQEAALSHIINADGEKLQAAIHMVDPSNSTFFSAPEDQPGLQDLLNTNDSVAALMENVTDYERGLRDKLNAVLDYIRGEQNMPTLMPVTVTVSSDQAGAVYTVKGTVGTDPAIFINRVATVDEDGFLHFMLPAGTFTLTQVTPIVGCTLDSTVHTLVVTSTSASTSQDGSITASPSIPVLNCATP